MLVKVLGLMDFITGASFILFYFNILPGFALFLAYYLIIKGLVFLFTVDFVSLVDIIIGLIALVFIYLNWHTILIFILVIWLLQKGFLSII